MKKFTLLALCLTLTASIYAASDFQSGKNGPDGQLFLDPHVSQLGNQVAAISVNIGSQLPSTTHFISQEMCKEIGLSAHFKHIAEKLQANEHVVVAAPASYGVVFTDGTQPEEAVYEHIGNVLAKIGSNLNPDNVQQSLSDLKEVYRATFAIRNDKLFLVTDEKQLSLGEQVWRKTPEGVEPNVYHSEEEYLVSFANSGFVVEEIKRPCFYGQLKYKMHQASLKEGEKGLGSEYIENHPFTIFYLAKKG